MCLVLTAWRAHPAFRLVVAANRDEFYERPTAPLDWWSDDPRVLAGRDLADTRGGGGTWMGVAHGGRMALVTNVRARGDTPAGVTSRGELPSRYLRGGRAPEQFLDELACEDDRYNGYNLLVSDLRTLWWHSNRAPGRSPSPVAPGVHGLSNAALDTPWPKVRNGVAAFTEVLRTDNGELESPLEPYFEVLADRRQASDDALPDTGIPLEWERLVSSAFISSPVYGTRCSTVLRVRHDGSFDVTERSFGPDGGVTGERDVQGTLTTSGSSEHWE